jgi:hypothetical protein
MSRNGARRENNERVCSICGRPYYRRNLVEGWIGQNPGHRLGWQKRRVAICTYCQPASFVSRNIMLVSARVVKRSISRRAREAVEAKKA